MNAPWRSVPLSEVVLLQRGHDLPTSDRGAGDVPIIGSFGVTGRHDTALYDGPGVAIGRSGAAIGTATYVTSPYWPLNTCLFVRDFKGNNPHWIYYLLDSIDFTSFNSGSAQPSLNRNFLRDFPVALPPLTGQQAIAEVLGALDDKIASNNRVTSVTQDLLSALHKHALSAGNPRVAPFFEVFNVDFGEAFKGDHFSEPQVGRPLIRIRDLKTFTPQVWTTESCPNEVIVQPGDVLVGMDAEFRATWWLGEPGLLNQRVCRVRGKHTGSAFVAESVRSPLRYIENEKSGTTVIHLNKSDLARSQVLVPPADLLAEFEEKGEPLVHSRVAIAVENRRLTHVRDQILPLLMSGKIRVREAEKVVEGVV